MHSRARDRGLVFVLAPVIGIAGTYYVKAVPHLDELADKNSELSYSDREIAGGSSIVINQEAAYEARALIPVTGSFRVLTGDSLRHATSLTLPYVEGWFRYFLFPRRTSGDARWIICYGCDPSAVGDRYIVRWRDANGISIGRTG
jgi:hypothetical protein